MSVGDQPIIANANALDLSDMRTFLTSPAPKGMIIQCFITRNKKGLKNKFTPSYELYLESDNRFLLSAKKRSKNKTSNYLISLDKDDMDKNSPHYVGKVRYEALHFVSFFVGTIRVVNIIWVLFFSVVFVHRANFVGTEFTIFDKGLNFKNITVDDVNRNSVRQELGQVHYESNILGTRGPRKMTGMWSLLASVCGSSLLCCCYDVSPAVLLLCWLLVQALFLCY